MAAAPSTFRERVQAGLTVGVVGLGYVGLPLVVTFGRRHRVVGFDIDATKVEALKRGQSYIRSVPAEPIAALVRDERFEPTTDFSRARACDALVICVPTPLTRQREPDMTYIENTARALGPHLKRGQLVVLESTTYPGTTDGPLRKTLEEASHLKAGQDFHLAFSPERIDPGNEHFDTAQIPKVVGGFSETCRGAAIALYESALDKVVAVSSTATAEMTKLLENIFRSVNIALVNELKVLCDRMGIDVWEVIAAAATKPFGYMPFYPGPGLGGHCIPVDPFYLTWKAREYGLTTRFIELAGEINTHMPEYVVQKTAEALNARKQPLNGSRILILGVAYKPGVNDVREAPALTIIELFARAGSKVSYHDPYVPHIPPTREHALNMQSSPLSDESLATCDAAVIITDHKDIDYARVVRLAPLIIDTRNATRAVKDGRDKIVKA